jgi:hypothetical protein
VCTNGVCQGSSTSGGGPNGGVVGIGGGALNPKTVGLAAAAAGGGRGADHELPPAGGRKPGCPGAAYEVAGPSTVGRGGGVDGRVAPSCRYWKIDWLRVTSCSAAPPPPALPRGQPSSSSSSLPPSHEPATTM